MLNDEKSKAPIEQNAPAVRTGSKLKGSYRIKAGHKIYEFNTATMTTSLAKIKTYYDVKRGKVNKLVEREGCIYLPALNFKNAERKFKALIDKAIQKTKTPSP